MTSTGSVDGVNPGKRASTGSVLENEHSQALPEGRPTLAQLGWGNELACGRGHHSGQGAGRAFQQAKFASLFENGIRTRCADQLTNRPKHTERGRAGPQFRSGQP